MSALDTIPLGRYMTAERIPANPDVYLVRDRHGGNLATVEWYPRWREYVVSPDTGAVFSCDCLRVLADFCERLTREHLNRPRGTCVRCMMPVDDHAAACPERRP